MESAEFARRNSIAATSLATDCAIGANGAGPLAKQSGAVMRAGNTATLTVPSVSDHEVVAIDLV